MAWSERHSPPDLHDLSKRLKYFVAPSFDEERHREVTGLEPLGHLLVTERT